MHMRVYWYLEYSLRFLALLAFVSAAGAADWRMYLWDPAHSSFNTSETKLSPQTVGNIGPAWTLSTGAVLAAGATVSDGVLYVGDWKGRFHAVEAATGRALWQRFVGMAAEPLYPSCQPAIGVTSQATVADGVVYVGGGDSAVYALDATTGRELWRTPLADPESGSYIWSSITLSGDVLYVGIASLGDCPLVRGGLARIDLKNPSEPLIRYLVPEGEIGGGVWSTPAVDEETNTVFVTTGTGEQDAEAGVWGGTLLALDATTLEIKAHFFLPTNSLEDDIEWGSSPTLFTTADGVPMVAATGKDGILYALRRDDLTLVWWLQVAIGCISPEDGCGSLSTPAFDGQTLYVGAGVADPEGDDGGSVWAIDPTAEQVLWFRSLRGVVIAPVTVANGVLYVSTTGGLEILAAETGQTIWSDPTFGPLYSQAVVVDGTVYSTFVTGQIVAWQ